VTSARDAPMAPAGFLRPVFGSPRIQRAPETSSRRSATFVWVGGFSSAPNTLTPVRLVPDPEKATKQLKLLNVSGGNKDGLINIRQGAHAHPKENRPAHRLNGPISLKLRR